MSSAGQLPPASSVLAVCAHPDDESFGLGAVLHGFARRGARVSVLCLTAGEASTLGSGGAGGVSGAGRAEVLGTLRKAELAEAARRLGVDDVELHDYPDGALSGVPLAELAGVVAAAAGRAGAELLLVFDDSGVTGHPDHRRATDAALRGGGGIPVLAWGLPLALAGSLNAEHGASFAGRDEDDFDFAVDVDRAAQRAAIACHVSQATDNPVLWRRLELAGATEWLRWLRPPVRGAAGAAKAGTGAGAAGFG